MPTEVVEQKFNEGEVVRAADDCKISEGSYVFFGDYIGHEIYEDSTKETLTLILEEDVICTMEEDE